MSKLLFMPQYLIDAGLKFFQLVTGKPVIANKIELFSEKTGHYSVNVHITVKRSNGFFKFFSRKIINR